KPSDSWQIWARKCAMRNRESIANCSSVGRRIPPIASTIAFRRAALAGVVAGSMSCKTPPSPAIRRASSLPEQTGVPVHVQWPGPRGTQKKPDTQGSPSCADGPLVSMPPVAVSAAKAAGMRMDRWRAVMPTMTLEQYLQDRIEDQIRWYGDRSPSNQRSYRRLRTSEILRGGSIPLLAGYVGEVPSLRVVVGAAGVLLAVIAGVFSLYRFHENWVAYRNTGEALKREKFLYLTGAPPYTEPNAFGQFVARCEALMGSEQEKWSVLFKANPQVPASADAATAGTAVALPEPPASAETS